MTLKSGINERESVNVIHNIKKRRRRRKNFDRIDHENLKYKISIKKILFKILLSILENETRESQYPQTNSNRSWSVNVRLPESFDQTPVMVPRLSRSPRPESLPLLDFPRPVHCSSLLYRYSFHLCYYGIVDCRDGNGSMNGYACDTGSWKYRN